jgi:hypothetical protein
MLRPRALPLPLLLLRVQLVPRRYRRLAQSGVRSGARAARDDVPGDALLVNGDAKLAGEVAKSDVS